MDNLEITASANNAIFDFANELLNSVLSQSTGEPTMSDEDMKLAIIHLRGIVLSQQDLLKALVVDRKVTKAQKFSFKNFLKK